VIFVTVGTHQQAFDRMLATVGMLPDLADVVLQYGYGKPPDGVRNAVDFMPFAEMERNFERAGTVITHAGVGSVLCARRSGHVPVVIPRLHELGEHVDDHQAELTRSMASLGAVIPLWPDDRLDAALASVPPRSERLAVTGGPLTDAVRQALGAPPAT
jgi:UDP-N-acetylglucosamine transferase subunit ALG13